MPGFEISMLSFWVVAIIICVSLLALLGLVSHFCAKFVALQKDLEANLIGLTGQLKRLQTSFAEQLIETRRSARLLHEQLELKRAEMTGDFEIIEEEIPETSASAKKTAAPAMKTPVSEFPKL